MNQHDDRKITLLMYTETADPPLSGVDLARVVRDGRRRRRRRALATQAIAIVTVAVLSLGAVLAGNVGNGPSPQPGQQPGISSDSRARNGAPNTLDPLRLHVAAGWVPKGLVPRPPVLGQIAQQIWFSNLSAYAGNHAGDWIDVTLYAVGVTPWQLLASPGDERPRPNISAAPAVNGQQAEWIMYDHADYSDGIAWEWAPNAWVVVRAELAEERSEREVLLRVAQNVRTDVDQPIALPFVVDTPPPPLRLVKTELREEPPWYSYTLEFGLEDSTSAPHQIDATTEPHDALTVSLTRREPGAERKPKPDRMIAGHPAAVRFGPTSGSVDLYDVSGYEVSVYISDPGGLRVIGESVAIALALSVTPLGEPTDHSRWTTSPLRQP